MTEPTVFAHRGFAGVNPENTVGAVRAAAHRADAVEVDVVACADGTPVVFHDARLDAAAGSRGVTDAAGAVRDLSPETVTAAEVLDSGETVPTLARLVDGTDAPLNVELKRHGAATVRRGALPPADREASRERWQPLVDRVLDALDGREIRYSSFREGALAALRARDPDASLAPLCRDLATGRELAARYDANAVHPSLAAIRDADAGTVAAVHDAGRAVNVWTIRTWGEARAAVRAGADGLIADYPELTRWLGGVSG
ncbi:glycerophosphodiester phosphodiesterase [Haloplanus halophilus]|uniref:glycerophosphodiester phosphodiesterase n=1 Tax=Haloplanus halophilus TaxID=2949993 RepID=UPI00203C45F1|nr:glycerophosphodiester phosphodiesterase [Haloplanus sp. GDY1]